MAFYWRIEIYFDL